MLDLWLRAPFIPRSVIKEAAVGSSRRSDWSGRLLPFEGDGRWDAKGCQVNDSTFGFVSPGMRQECSYAD
jgi:hypothetical protein